MVCLSIGLKFISRIWVNPAKMAGKTHMVFVLMRVMLGFSGL